MASLPPRSEAAEGRGRVGEGYERFWTRNLDSLGAYLERIQPKAAPKKRKSK